MIRASSHRRAEIVIVGGGPAGSTLARELALRGRSVLLVDRAVFPRAKPCGDCLNPGGVAVLARLGLLDRIRNTHPVPLSGWNLTTPGRHTARGDFPPDSPGLGVDRGTFDHSLLVAAREAGVEVEEGVRVTDVSPQAGGGPVALAEKGGEQLRLQGKILVGADGLRSVVARRVGAVRRAPRTVKASFSWRMAGSGPPRDRGFLLLGGELTVGVAPAPSNNPEGHTPEMPRWNGTVVVDPQRFRKQLRDEDPWRLFRTGLERLGLDWSHPLEPLQGPWASGPFDVPVRTAALGRIVLVGDAAGYFDPLTGQGMFRALRSAELAAPAIDRALPPSRSSSVGSEMRPHPPSVDEAVLSDYAKALHDAFQPTRRLQRAIDRVLAAPRLREWTVAALGRHPELTSQFIRVTGDLEAARSLLNPLQWGEEARPVHTPPPQRSRRQNANG